MSQKRQLFGTDGIRGKANIYPMTGEIAMALGRAVTCYFQKTKKNHKTTIVIGKDTRRSCYMIEQAFAAGVCSQGGLAILTGPLPTPGVAFATQSMRAVAGVMISASHNRYSDNGIKIFDHNGSKLPDEVELELEKLVMQQNSLPVRLDEDLGRATRLDEVIGRYIVHTKGVFEQDYTLEGMRLIVDCSHGAAYRVAPMIFSELGAEVYPMGVNPNGININDGCGSLSPQACAEKVINHRADLGICLDGDGDRVVLIDHEGNVVDGDKLIGLCSRYLLEKEEFQKGSEIVGTIMSNLGLENYVHSIGLKFTRTAVGDRYILGHMQTGGALFGGEPSGHLIFKKYSTTGDGIIAALKIIEAMLFYKKTLKDLIADIHLYPQVLKNIEVKKKPEFTQNAPIAKALKDVETRLGDTGRVLLRYSGTEPLARVMIEGKDSTLIHGLCNELSNVVAKELG